MKCKKIFAVLLVVLLFVCFSVPAFAVENNSRIVSRKVEQYSNGGYMVVTVYDDTTTRASTKNGHKDFEYYESGSLRWIFTVYGSFSYNGSSSTCTAASYTYSINDGDWSKVSGEAYPSGSAAIAKGVMQKKSTGKKVSPSVTLTCTATGVLV